MPDATPLAVLFVCTGNSARSILAEALLNHAGGGRFVAYSAGSDPTAEVNPRALATLRALGVSSAGARSKSWDEFAAADAPRVDVVITVCDNAAAEVCPVWPGGPVAAHWGVPDPAAATGSDEARSAAFRDAARVLERRIDLLIALPRSALDAGTAGAELREIGRR